MVILNSKQLINPSSSIMIISTFNYAILYFITKLPKIWLDGYKVQSSLLSTLLKVQGM